jgi:hypothetical protein
MILAIKNLIRSRKVKPLAIELNGDNRIDDITNIMTKNVYVVAGYFDHYPDYKPTTIDRMFLKKEYLKNWK